MGHVFISYARHDRAWAEQVDRDLTRAGFATWRDTRDIDPNQDFTSEIEDGIRAAAHVVVCLTADVRRTDSFVRREIQYALNQDKQRRQQRPPARLPLVPLVFPGGELPVHISTWTAIFLRDQKYDRLVAELLGRLRSPDDGKEQPTYRDDRETVAYLEDLHEWCSARLAETVAHLLPLEVKEAPEASREPHRAPLRVGFSVSKAVDVTAAAKNTEFLERRFDSLKSALEAHDGRALLLGAPGAGKTTSLLAFARDAAVARLSDPSNPLPVLASIPSWSSKAELRPWLERVSPWPRQTSDNLLFLLDGLDELGGPRRKDPSNERSELYDPRKLFLEALERDIPGGSIVVTSRDREYKEIRGPASFGAIVTVQPLSDAQVQAYLTARHQASVLELARHDEDFAALVRTPLLLGMGSLAIGPDAAAPSEGNVFDQGFVFDRYIARRFVHEASVADRLWFDEQETRARLATLGAWMWIDFDAGIDSAFQYWVVTERTSLDATRAFELIGPDAERFVRFCARMNLLREERDGGFAFQHLKLRDFCALPALFQLVDWRVNQLPLPSSPNPLRLDLREYPAAVAADHMTRIADAARAALLSVARGGIDLVETARRLGRVAKPAANEARLRYSSSPELVIPDSNPSLVHSTIRVDEAGRLAEITVHLDIEHAWIGDLKIRLHSPSGAVVTLHDRQGGAAKRANSPATSVLHQSLAALRGTDCQGVWTLEISDHVEGDGGVLHGWALDMRVGT